MKLTWCKWVVVGLVFLMGISPGKAEPLRSSQVDVDALFAAISAGDIPRIRDSQKKLGNLDAYRDQSGDSALQVAVRAKQTSVILYLIDKGYVASINSPDHEKVTPLLRAVLNDDYATLQLLMTKNPNNRSQKVASVNQKDGNGWTPLSFVVNAKNKKYASVFAYTNANANVIDPDGLTPLGRAVKFNDLDLVNILLDGANADVRLRDKFGQRAIDYARPLGNKAIIALVDPALRGAPGHREMMPMMAAGPGFQHVYDEPQEAYYTVTVPFATNRKRSGFSDADNFYSEEIKSGLDYGVANVTIPRSHTKGHLESPGLFDLHADAKDDIILKTIDLQSQDVFMRTLGDDLERRSQNVRREDENDVFLFIHGFNTQFAYAVRKTAQLAIDLEFRGLPMTFSWPAQSSTVPMPWDFKRDAAAIDKSMINFYKFVQQIRAKLKPDKKECLHLVAHSLGNRALIQILSWIATKEAPLMTKPGYVKPFCEVVLASPATDAQFFVKNDAVKIRKVAARVTIYASNNDKALGVEWLAEASNFSFPLGSKSSQGFLALTPEIETVDLSKLSVGIFDFNHAKYSDLPQVEDDIRHLLIDRWSAADRFANGAKIVRKFMQSLFVTPAQSLPYWEMFVK